MEKAGIKAFVFSFSLSLSALIVADKILECAPKKNQEDLIISNKNIVLFINDNLANSVPQAQPIKKIALNVLPEVVSKGTSTIQSAELSLPKTEETVIAADSLDDKDFSFNYIPLDIEVGNNNMVEPLPANQPIKLADAAPSADIEAPTAKVQIKEKPVNKIVVVKPEPAVVKSTPEEKVERAISESRPQQPLNNKKPEQVQNQNILVADAALGEPTLLIPLERGNGADFLQADMHIAQDDGENQIAATDKSVPIKSLGTPEKPIEATTTPQNDDDAWKSMAEIRALEKKDTDNREQQPNSAWSVAKGRDFPKNSMVLEADTNKSEAEIQQQFGQNSQTTASRGGEIQVAGEMIDNLLIPIPKDILEDENLTPQLTSSEANRNIERELEEDRGIVRDETAPQNEQEVEILDAQGKNIHKKGEGILSSITSIFSSNDKSDDGAEDADEDGGIMDSIARKLKGKKDEPKILPTEIRLSFQPNRAEISGSTLQWIQAFGNKAAQEASVALEIRLNAGGDRILQQKRLNLLSNILNGRGVDSSKIRVVYTTREPNSFVMRTIWINEQNNEGLMRNNTQNNNGYYLQW